ncbi:DUF6010 family protein [Metabacillus sp. B2-18]|uniref:DUF6010 family protein n=1 Tax=Metabacillus sp. B2-18 TaxID=2897333 RepID=UPI001E2A1A16|nr:DUF6010 family protein [Metabacillus sp. B2-18]UGB30570.1 DUF6010 family protein [Metabacillus sp. B2-18]
MKKIEFKSVVVGILLALLVCKLFFSFSSPFSYQLFALFLAYTACVYLGAALSDSRVKWISIEFGLSCLFFNLAFLGLIFSPLWIAVGYLLHGVWDLLHHPKIIQTKVVKWFPPLCAVFDLVVAIFIIQFY